jgi:hypothetical protein
VPLYAAKSVCVAVPPFALRYVFAPAPPLIIYAFERLALLAISGITKALVLEAFHSDSYAMNVLLEGL